MDESTLVLLDLVKEIQKEMEVILATLKHPSLMVPTMEQRLERGYLLPDIALEKSLPHSAEAERAVLGAVLLDNTLFDQTSEILIPGDFYLESHRSIFSTMERLSSDSRVIDSLTLREELKKDNTLEAVGGVAYIASLLDGVPRVSSVDHYSQIVKEKSLLRNRRSLKGIEEWRIMMRTATDKAEKIQSRIGSIRLKLKHPMLDAIEKAR